MVDIAKTIEDGKKGVGEIYTKFLDSLNKADLNDDKKTDMAAFQAWLAKQTEEVKNKYAESVKVIGEKAEDIQATIKPYLDAAKKKTSETVETLKDGAAEVGDTVVKTGKKLDDDNDNIFSKNKGTLIGAGIAAVVGLMSGSGMMALLALLAAVVIGAFTDGKDGMLGGLVSNMFPGEKKDKTDGVTDPEKNKGAGDDKNTTKSKEQIYKEALVNTFEKIQTKFNQEANKDGLTTAEGALSAEIAKSLDQFKKASPEKIIETEDLAKKSFHSTLETLVKNRDSQSVNDKGKEQQLTQEFNQAQSMLKTIAKPEIDSIEHLRPGFTPPRPADSQRSKD